MKIMKIKAIATVLLVSTGILMTAMMIEESPQEILFEAVNRNDINAANQILALSAWEIDVNAKNALGQTMLMCAAIRGYEEMVDLLLNEGAFIDATNTKGETPLMLAASNGHAPVVALLLSRGADVTKTNLQDQDVLDIATSNNRNDIVKIIKDFKKKRREEVKQPILEERPEVYPVIAEEIAEFEIGK